MAVMISSPWLNERSRSARKRLPRRAKASASVPSSLAAGVEAGLRSGIRHGRRHVEHEPADRIDHGDEPGEPGEDVTLELDPPICSTVSTMIWGPVLDMKSVILPVPPEALVTQESRDAHDGRRMAGRVERHHMEAVGAEIGWVLPGRRPSRSP